MVYNKQDWRDEPNHTTPLSGARLRHMETQYDEAVAVIPEVVTQALASDETIREAAIEAIENAGGTIGGGAAVPIEDPSDPGLYFIPTGMAEDPANPGLYLIGA